ncbi:MAG: hypothetical protein ACREOY_15205 [Candidatus Dormibacteraceae bacterium]
MSQEQNDRYAWGHMSWASWGSPIGLGLFFVLGAIAVDIVRFAFK